MRIKTYRLGGDWGNRIEWTEFDQRRVVGWQTFIPEPGDYLICPITGGRLAQFRFVEIERCDQPEDMFFATVQDMGYVE